ncbi:MAG TPA: hypothetical protein VEP90_19615 [Methylomirabilota bacterium]|nr:hypothetical protein [Methylomirabilota bacterium]
MEKLKNTDKSDDTYPLIDILHELPSQARRSAPGSNVSWRLWGVVALAVIIGSVLWWNANLSTPTKALDTFCAALKNGDNDTADAQLTPGFLAVVRASSDAAAKSHKPISDYFISCTHGSLNEGQSSTGVTFDCTSIFFHENSGKVAVSIIQLIKNSNGEWKISDIVLPTVVNQSIRAFCMG